MTEQEYKIIRFYRSGNKRIIHKDVSLEVAQLHCRSEKTQKLDKKGIPVWFDGYATMKI